MEILPNQISLNLEIESTSSLEASLVNRIAQRAKEKGKTMPVTSGPKCFELFEKSDRATSWGRMFMDSLLGTADLFSTRCVLIWKLKVTPYGRLLFQLQPSTRRTEGTAFGLLPTPTTQESAHYDANLTETNRRKCNNGNSHSLNLTDQAIRGLLPTPRTADIEGGCVDNVQIENGSYFRTNANGVRWGVKLRDVVESGLLPTPKTQDSRHALRDRGKSNLGEEMSQSGQDNGKGSRLNPQFVAEMMGFPSNWTELPFQNGETKA